jgi:hypothetical protein
MLRWCRRRESKLMPKCPELKENSVNWVCDTPQNTPSAQMRLPTTTKLEFARMGKGAGMCT